MRSILKGKNNSFFNRTFFSFLGAVVMIAFILVLCLAYNYIRLAVSLIFNFNDKLLTQSNYSITYIDDLAQRLSYSLYMDEKVIAYLNSEEEDTMVSIQAMQSVEKHILPMNYVESVYLYNAKRDTFISTATGLHQSSEDFYDQVIAENVTNRSVESSTNPIFHVVQHGIEKRICSYIIYDTNSYDSDLLNAIVINVDAKTLTQSIKEISMASDKDGTEYMVFDDNGQLLESTLYLDSQQEQDLMGIVQQVMTSSDKAVTSGVNIEGTDYLLSCDSNNPNNWYIFGLTPEKLVYADVIQSSLISLGLVIFIIGISCVLVYFISKHLYTPLREITNMVNRQSDSLPVFTKGKDEFQFLTSVFQSIQKQNEQFARFKTEAVDSARQDFVNTLLSGNNILSLDNLKKKLEVLNLSHLTNSSLCMCLLKIDRYNDFYTSNNQKERWALRYAIVNIVSEISAKYFSCEIFSRNSDKFIVLVKCENGISNYVAFQEKLETMLRDIQKQIHNIHLTLSISYSTIFNGLDHLHSTYNTLEDMIQLKMQYGHECIINPYMLDEVNTDTFQKPVQENLLLEQVCAGESEQVQATYGEIFEQLQHYNSDEVYAYMMHLAYVVCTTVQFKNPYARQEATEQYKKFMSGMAKCEVFSDIEELADKYLQELTSRAGKASADPTVQNNELIAQKVCAIIEENYQRKDLCLSMIAEELELSPNYVGHLFKQVQQMSVSRYILELRLEKVGDYLRTTDLSLSEITELVGLEKNNYFYTCFKRHFGISLSEYKNNLKRDGE